MLQVNELNYVNNTQPLTHRSIRHSKGFDYLISGFHIGKFLKEKKYQTLSMVISPHSNHHEFYNEFITGINYNNVSIRLSGRGNFLNIISELLNERIKNISPPLYDESSCKSEKKRTIKPTCSMQTLYIQCASISKKGLASAFLKVIVNCHDSLQRKNKTDKTRLIIDYTNSSTSYILPQILMTRNFELTPFFPTIAQRNYQSKNPSTLIYEKMKETNAQAAITCSKFINTNNHPNGNFTLSASNINIIILPNKLLLL